MKKILIVFSLSLLVNCNKSNSENSQYQNFNSSNSSSVSKRKATVKKWNGDYCAEVDYFNPKTGTLSNYKLTIQVINSALQVINFPNGGYLEDFDNVIINDEGFTELISENGYHYKLQIVGDVESCFNNTLKTQQCKGITVKGNQCKNVTDNANKLCWRHKNQEKV